MTFLFSLMLVQAATGAPPAPAEWSALPRVSLARPSAIGPSDTMPVLQMAERRRECRASAGAMPAPAQAPNARMRGLNLELIVLVAPDGRLLNIVAAPGPCDAIRNYARALINRDYRGRLRPPAGRDAAWYRTSVGFSWEQ